MKRIVIVSGGLIAFAAALAVTLHRPDEPENKPEAVVDASAKRALSEARAARAELADLRSQIGQLDRSGRRSVAPALPRDAAAPAAAHAQPAPSRPSFMELEPEEQMEAARNRADEVQETFEDTLESEPRDSEWANTAERTLAHSLDSFDAAGRAQVVSSKCGSTICMAELEFADRDTAEELRHHITIGEEFGFTRRSSAPGELPLRQVYFLARPGHRLPMPS
ncbi:MAG: hypothetical protein AAF799_02180 [Myxococcota bacterium]